MLCCPMKEKLCWPDWKTNGGYRPISKRLGCMAYLGQIHDAAVHTSMQSTQYMQSLSAALVSPFSPNCPSPLFQPPSLLYKRITVHARITIDIMSHHLGSVGGRTVCDVAVAAAVAEGRLSSSRACAACQQHRQHTECSRAAGDKGLHGDS